MAEVGGAGPQSGMLDQDEAAYCGSLIDIEPCEVSWGIKLMIKIAPLSVGVTLNLLPV